MKKLLFALALIASGAIVSTAQEKTTQHTTVTKDEKTVKKTSTVPQKVHNTFSKKKKYSGKKTKHVTTTETKTTPTPNQ